MISCGRRIAVFGLLIGLWLTQPAGADSLSIVGEDATWTGGANSSCQFILEIKSETDPPSLLTGWQLTCEIVPDQAATGQVWFSSITQPSDYVFDGITRQNGITPSGDLNTRPTQLAIEDDIFDSILTDGINPVSVPSTGVNLLQIGLASSQAAGRFDIRIVGDGQDSGSVWFSETFDSLPFDIAAVPGRSSDVIESLVFGSVPEPSAMVLFSSAGSVFALGFGWRRRRKLTLAE